MLMWPGETPLPLLAPAESSPWWLRRSSCSWPTSSYLQGMSAAARGTALKEHVPSLSRSGVKVQHAADSDLIGTWGLPELQSQLLMAAWGRGIH